MKHTAVSDIETELLIEALSRRYGYDFSNYSKASLKRRIEAFAVKKRIDRISDLISLVLHDRQIFQSLLYTLTVTVTEMFRDPSAHAAIRQNVAGFLKTYPFIRIWHAGCSCGEEVYSMAILLKEEGLYDRAQIYATDINDEALAKAKEGIYPVEDIKTYTANYFKSGGRGSLADYYQSKYNSVIMDRGLKKNIIFANHNLVSDGVFGEMHLVMCRNVLIYFDRTLQERVLRLFHDSLVINGFLCLGTKESLRFSGVEDCFKKIAEKENIFQKKSGI